MARAKSPKKRDAILRAAVQEIAQVGLGASTTRIAKAAGLAEGTIFTYFATKDELLNQLYIEVKTEVHQRIQRQFPVHSDLKDRARHIWTSYLLWAIESPNKRKVSQLLHLSPKVTAASREQVDTGWGEVARTIDELNEQGAFRDLPAGFAASAMSALQDSVMELAISKPRQRMVLIERTFAAFWRMAV